MIQQNLIKALLGLLLLLILMAVAGYAWEDELSSAANWVTARIGFAGMAMILMVTDTLVTPFPPDVLLVIIANSELQERWPLYVGILGIVSVCAGMTGYLIGRQLGHTRWSQRLFGDFRNEHQDFIRKYGFWAIVLGSITPLPYSVTCWSAGVMGVRWQVVLAASLLFRIPRLYLYYFLLTTAGSLF